MVAGTVAPLEKRMKEFTRKVVSAVAPVLGVTAALAVFQASGLPFPPPLAWDAWAQWLVFAAVSHACIGVCMYAAARFAGEVPPNASGPSVGPA